MLNIVMQSKCIVSERSYRGQWLSKLRTVRPTLPIGLCIFWFWILITASNYQLYTFLNSIGVIHLGRPHENRKTCPCTCVHMSLTPSPLWTFTSRRHEIHITLLKRL